jgi:DNA (cytosine-5)-methyltransferase 1
VSITKRHFPDIQHVGDITKLSGAELPSVDIISFGSPCQDLSVAGKRAGLSGERSGLFMEAIRIIKEMRLKTNGKYPRYALWENVPGALNSGHGLDFKAVLKAFTDTEIPMPQSGRWAHSGMVRSDGVDLAWCIYNAADFGLAQRRKRVFLIADFGGFSAGEILFIPKSLPWNFAASRKTGQSVAASVAGGIDGANSSCLNPWDTQQARIFEENGTAPTLAGADGGGGRNPAGLIMKQTVYGICADHSNSMLSDNPQSGVYEADTSRTLDTNGGNPACNQGGMVVAAFMGRASAGAGSTGYSEEVSPTLRAGMTPCVCEPDIAILNDQGGASINVERENLSPTLRCCTHGNLPVICAASNPHIIHPQISGTLCGSGSGLNRPGGQAAESDLTIAYCLQGNMIGRDDKNGPQGNGINENISFTLNATDIPAVAAVDCRNLKEIGNQSGTLQAKSTAGYSLNFQNPIRTGYIVRRLTPTECERLMGFPDGWTSYGHDGMAISDSRRYQMLGNSVAIPCVAHIMRGIAEELCK